MWCKRTPWALLGAAVATGLVLALLLPVSVIIALLLLLGAVFCLWGCRR